MDGYILELRNKYGNLTQKKPQYSPHKHRPIYYGATQKLVQPTDDSPPLNDKGIKRAQGMLGALIYIGRSVNNKLLVALRAIWVQQEAATEETKYAIEQLLAFDSLRNPSSACATNIISLFRKKYTVLRVGFHIIQ